jgi:hypothetical protein
LCLALPSARRRQEALIKWLAFFRPGAYLFVTRAGGGATHQASVVVVIVVGLVGVASSSPHAITQYRPHSEGVQPSVGLMMVAKPSQAKRDLAGQLSLRAWSGAKSPPPMHLGDRDAQNRPTKDLKLSPAAEWRQSRLAGAAKTRIAAGQTTDARRECARHKTSIRGPLSRSIGGRSRTH